MKIIKGIRQKQSSESYSSLVPIGSEGKYIEMNSNLNLENELKLGTDHFVIVEEGEYEVPEQVETIIAQNRITEYYTTEEKIENFPYYKTITYIVEDLNKTDIYTFLYNVLGQDEEELLHSKIGNIIDEEDGGTKIKEEVI